MRRWGTVTTVWLAGVLIVAGCLPAPVGGDGGGRQAVISRVSVDAAGGDANGESRSTSISANGRFVAFESGASDIVAGAGSGQVYLRDRARGVTRLVSVNTAGQPANVGAFHPSVSGDGRFIVFQSSSTDLVPGDVDDTYVDVYVRDMRRRVTTKVSVDPFGGPADAGSDGRCSISANGRFVAFESAASNLIADDGNAQPDVFVRDLAARRTVLAGPFARIGSDFYDDSPTVLSDDGRYVTFLTHAPLVPGDTDGTGYDVYVRDLHTGEATLVSDAPEVQVVASPAISGNGRRVAYINAPFGLIRGGDVLVRDVRAGTTTRANVGTGDPASFSFSTPTFSRDGRYLAFDSTPVNENPDNTPLESNIFVRDLDRATTRKVSLSLTGAEPNGSSFDTAISGDGRAVAFVSGASDLVVGDTNGLRDIFVADLHRPQPYR
jgi:Tol biopolymer transport system component